MLVHSFLQRGDTTQHRTVVSPAAMAALSAYDWPGNIRELRNVMDRARLFADDGTVRPEHLPEWLMAGTAVASTSATAAAARTDPASAPQAAGRHWDDDALRQAVQASRCTRKELAQQLGLSERTLYRRLKALGLA
jgi:DNA-binding NtrC family response regulator